jgi:plasmid stabilization system protein ParE
MYKVNYTATAQEDLLSIVEYLSSILKAPTAAMSLLDAIEKETVILVVCKLQSFNFLRSKRCEAAFVSNKRYQYPRVSPGKRMLRLLCRPKGRGISPCFPGTRSGVEPSRCFHSARFVGESDILDILFSLA